MLVLLILFSAATRAACELPYQVVKKYDEQGVLERTVILPKIEETEELPFDNFVLVSNSSFPVPIEVSPLPTTQSPPIRKRIRRRRRKKKPTKQTEYVPDPTEVTDLSSDESAFNYKNSKFLNLFTIVQFPNEDCPDGGTCYHEYECANLGGTAGESCAKGYGVCCMIQTKCGESGEFDKRVFRSGAEYSGICSLTVQKSNCAKQIRLDFVDLELDPPENGDCTGERLLISGQNRNSPIPVICGSNSGQHVYADMDEASGPLMISVLTETKKDFKIKVTQICENNKLMAPKHCLQYYIGNTGSFRSFNYSPLPSSAASYMNNMNYAVCIRKGPGMCTIEYSNEEGGKETPFEMNNVDPDGSMTVPPGQAGAEAFNCPDDFITVRSVRLCGQKVNDASYEPDFSKNAPILDTSSGPFMVSVVSNEAVAGRGFNLYYRQNAC